MSAKYPDPKFFRFKDHINWKAQAENIKESGGIVAGLLKETDWKDVGKATAGDMKAFAKRVSYEASLLRKMSAAEKKDLLLNGEKQLGKLYRSGKMATVRREWRGLKDTGVDFYEWCRMWGMLLATFSKDLIPALGGAVHYRWMISYFCCHSFMDKNTLGLRGKALKMHHELIYAIFRYVAENLVLLMKGDEKVGNSVDLSKKVVLLDEMTMAQIMAGFPDLVGIPYQLMPVFLLSEIDQLACEPYIDAVESYGLPSDTCPVPTSECGACVVDALPHLGACFISSSIVLHVKAVQGSSDLPPCLPGTLRGRIDHRQCGQGYQGLHQVHRGSDRCKVELGRLFRCYEAVQRGDKVRAPQVGSQPDALSAAHRSLLRTLPQVEL